MIDVSIIIFTISLIAIIAMFISQYKRLKKAGELEKEFPPKDLSYESFQSFTIRLKKFWLALAHSIAIIISKLWARLTHYLSHTFNKTMSKIEERIIKSEKKNNSGESQSQSVFLTTIKTYKHEIKKLKGRVEEEAPRPREDKGLDKTE